MVMPPHLMRPEAQSGGSRFPPPGNQPFFEPTGRYLNKLGEHLERIQHLAAAPACRGGGRGGGSGAWLSGRFERADPSSAQAAAAAGRQMEAGPNRRLSREAVGCTPEGAAGAR